MNDKNIGEKLSENGFAWKKKDYLQYFADGVKQKFRVNDVVAKILSARFQNFEQIEIFLKPMISNLMPNPLHLKGMEDALIRIHKALKNNEKIAIFGDYDVDGATSTALLFNYLRELKIASQFHIPDRIKEGYGPNENALRSFKDDGVDLCFLLDCGSVAHAPLAFAKKIGLDVIVIDHHISSEILPEANALINPNRFDQESSCSNLAAVGVVFLMLVALNTFLEKENFFEQRQLKKPDLMTFLDLVAFGTVCDVMELSRLNRVFVKKGLEVFGASQNLGIKTMLQFLSLEEKIGTYHLGFVFGPRINAGGRIGNAGLGATLLTSQDIGACYDIVSQLNDLNEKRKGIEDIALKEAILKTHKFFGSSQEDVKKQAIVIVSGNWHPGINGIIASRLKDIYNLPAIAISFYEEGPTGKASCRSIPKIDMGAAIFCAKEKKIIIDGGGHKMAAGFSIQKDNIDSLREFLNEVFFEKLNSCNSHIFSEFDDYIDINEINIPFYQQLRILEPFGAGNPEPKFVIPNVRIMEPKVFGGKHISCYVKQNNLGVISSTSFKGLRALAFGNSVKNNAQILLEKPQSVDLMGTISFKNWNGKEYLEFIISDVRRS